ncbi:mitochondrial carrier protein [Coprinopsis sp. MPI-PUGE-AT-0042]|nr:mitochondrial carrier protein [Coprinopsis sp. MPI-PUGE-AT-0042]
MSLLASSSTSCRSLPRHASQLTSSLSRHQTRGAAQSRGAPVKKVQVIGGLKKGKDDKKAAKVARERTHASRDIPMFTRMSEDKLKTPKSGERPATLNPLFEPGLNHSLNLPLFEPKAIKRENVGTVHGFDLKPTNPAKVFGLPKKMFLEFRVMSNPSSVIRDVTVSTLSKLDEARNSPSVDNRYVLSGRAGSGKSYLLHQAVQHAAQSQDYITIYIPRSASLINSTTPHVYDLRTQTYLQPLASYQLIQKLLQVNHAKLEKIKLKEAVHLTQPIPAPELREGKREVFEVGMNLADVIGIALKDKSYGSSSVVLEGVLKGLEAQDAFPVLFAVDDFQALFHKSAYKDPFFNSIKSFHLSVPRMILDYASGRRGFQKGAIMTSLNASDTQYNIPLELRDTLELGYAHPVSPYEKRSSELMYYLGGDAAKAKGMQKIAVPDKFTVEEAGALFEMWKNDMALSSRAYDEMFLAKYVEADGNPRDFVWKGLLSTLAP